MVKSDQPTTIEAVDTSENTPQCSNVNLEITKSPSAAVSVSELSSTVVRITESSGASVKVSKCLELLKNQIVRRAIN